jgi:gamma-glutamyltranspeptidase/glutathione hydrolase
MPPPSSGQIAVMQTLGVLERLPLAGLAPLAGVAGASAVAGIPGADWLHAYIEAARLAFADRAQYVADPDFAPAPGGGWAGLLGADYLNQRATLVGAQAMKEAPVGRPIGTTTAWAPMPDQPEYGTSHLSVVDAQGRAVALTTSIEAGFGSRVMADGGTGLAGGYLLNNEMTDFSLAPADAQGRPVANRVQPGKRPRSSMSPTFVFDAPSGQLLMAIGSPGGPFIVHFVARTLIGTADWGLDLQRAIDAPNFGTLGGPVLLETGRFPATTQQALRDRGHRVVETALTSGLHGIRRTASGWEAGADPRREGVAAGD